MKRFSITFRFPRLGVGDNYITELTFMVYAGDSRLATDRGFQMLEALNPELLAAVADYSLHQF